MLTNSQVKWLVNRTNPEYINYISRLASVSNAFAQVLINRGIKKPDEIDSFLNPDTNKLPDPFELPEMKKAIERIKDAKKRGEIVLVHGDYDADGITSTAIMVEGLSKFGLKVYYFIPNRLVDGYGFGLSGVKRAKELGAKLIITVDCGITSFEAVSIANSYKIDVIITDHHEPIKKCSITKDKEGVIDSFISYQPSDFLRPDAFAVINPKLSSNNITFYNLSGVGIAFNLIYALFGNNISDVYEFLDLAAIGTGADVVPVLGENRVILKHGINLIQSGNRIGISALKEAAGIRADFFKTSLLYYAIIPRINAAGRIDDANAVVRLLTTRSEAEAENLAKRLNELNSKRQEIEESVYQEAMEMLKSKPMGTKDAIVLASEGWHIGVVGIVASRIAEQYNRPTFILSIENGIARGSARSIPSFDIYDALTQCKDVLIRFGGHRQAAGLGLSADSLEQFRSMINKIIYKTLSEDDFIPVLNLDASISLQEIRTELIDEISRLEPFGYGNDEPLFGSKGLKVMQSRIVGNNHLKIFLKQNGKGMDSIGFDLGGLIDIVQNNSLIDAAFIPSINEWNGEKHLQLNLKALRPAI